MIPRETVGGIKIPIGKRFGLIPRHHKAALFLSFDSDPNKNETESDYRGDITVHGHTMYLGTCCDGSIHIDRNTQEIRFIGDGTTFTGKFDPQKDEISGKISLSDIENLRCDELPVCFKPIEE